MAHVEGPHPGGAGTAILESFHSFRFKEGRTVERRDVRRKVPEDARNTNGMF